MYNRILFGGDRVPPKVLASLSRRFGSARVTTGLLATTTAVVALLLLSGAAGAATPSSPSGALPTGSHGHLAISTTTIKVGKSPTWTVYDPSTKEVYVSDSGASTISVISGTKVTQTITGVKDPGKLSYDAKSSLIYVESASTKSVYVIQDSTNKVIATITGFSSFDLLNTSVYDASNGAVYLLSGASSTYPYYPDLFRLPTASPWKLTAIVVGYDAISAVYDPGTGDVVTLDYISSNLSIVSGATNKVTTIKLPAHNYPESSVYNPANKDLYIADQFFNGGTKAPRSGNVSVLDSSNAIKKTLKVPAIPITMTLNPYNHDVYVLNISASGIKKSTSSLTPITSSNTLGGSISVGEGAILATYDPTNHDMYVPAEYSNLTYIISGSTNKLLTKVTTKGSPIAGIADEASGDIAVILATKNTTAGKLDFLSSPTTGYPKIVGTVTLGNDPYSFSYDASSNLNYVACRDSNDVVVFA
jgi:DNA-binding beta-propeller fold protein YncE